MASRTAYSTWIPQKPTLFDDHYLRNRSTLDVGVLGYIGTIQHKEHSPEVLSIPPGTPCIVGFSKASTLSVGPTQPTIQKIQEGLFPGTEAAEGANLTTDLWSLTSVPPYALVVLRFIMHSDTMAVYLHCITCCGVSPVPDRINFQKD